MILLDTDHLSVALDHRHTRFSRLTERLAASDDRPAISIISIEEQVRSWLAEINRRKDVELQVAPYNRLANVVLYASRWTIVRWDESAAKVFKRFRREGIRVGTQDLKIASIALVNDALLLSANLRDFERISGLRVEDWLYG